MISAKADSSALRAKLAAARRGAGAHAAEAMAEPVAAFADFVEANAPRDTQRYVGAWMQAVNGTGLDRRNVPMVRRSSRHDAYIKRLTSQRDKYARMAAAIERTLERWYDAKGRRRDAWYRKRAAVARRLRKLEERAEEQLRRALAVESFVLIGGRRLKSTVKIGKRTERITGLATVRTEVYGGRGAVLTTAGHVVIRLHNLEPHAALVERRAFIARRGLEAARGAGARSASGRFLAAIGRDTGLTLARGSVSGTRRLPRGVRIGV